MDEGSSVKPRESVRPTRVKRNEMLKLLNKGDEDQRRWNIVEVGRARYVPQLLARLTSDETDDNKRHIVRALGNIGDLRAEAPLLKLLESSTDLMLGDVVHSLGQLESKKAIPTLKSLLDHEVEWVRQNAKWALAQFAADS
jgi:HEAT repeat protein